MIEMIMSIVVIAIVGVITAVMIFIGVESYLLASRRMALTQEARVALVRMVREVRNRYLVDARTALDVSVRCDDAVARDFLALAPFVVALAAVGRLECGPQVRKSSQSATCVHGEFEAYVSLQGLIDVEAELKRLEKQAADKQKQLQGIQAKLENPNFANKAPAEVVSQHRDLARDLQDQIRVIEENVRDLRQG